MIDKKQSKESLRSLRFGYLAPTPQGGSIQAKVIVTCRIQYPPSLYSLVYPLLHLILFIHSFIQNLIH